MEETAKMISVVEKLNGGEKGVEYVSDAVIDAVCNRFPLSRYVIGWDAHLINSVLKHLPDWMVDWAQTLS